jgi:DNA-binding transcriptional MerR regulator
MAKPAPEQTNTFSPAQVKDWFGISRTTLFRWEQENRIPKTKRGNNKERAYDQTHLRRIYELVCEKLNQELELSVRDNPDDEQTWRRMMERIYKAKLFAGDPNVALNAIRELKAVATEQGLSQDTAKLLVDYLYSGLCTNKTARRMILEVLLENEKRVE